MVKIAQFQGFVTYLIGYYGLERKWVAIHRRGQDGELMTTERLKGL